MRSASLGRFETMAADQITTTEQWIREKLQLQHVCLADVRSLSLPGTYETGKILNLGISLKNFVRLKCLDLSHNALVSVAGIVHLKLLERLNLYFNRISSLQEVLALCKLENLQELDLRLNPVAQKPDYRLRLVHSLAQLRKLDDCVVRDRERKVALMYFSPEPEPEIIPTLRLCTEKEIRSGEGRIASVNRMMTRLYLRDGNEEIVFGHNSNEDRNIKRQEGPPVALNKEKRRAQSRRSLEISPSHSFKRRPSVLPNEAPRVTFVEPPLERHSSTRLRVTEARKLRDSRIQAKSNFTPHPGHESTAVKGGRQEHVQTEDMKLNSEGPADGDPARASPEPKRAADFHKGTCKKPFELMLSLVEEYWAEKRKGQNTKHFFMHAVRILCMMEQEVARGKKEIKSLRVSLQTMKSQADQQEKQRQAESRSLSQQLQQANDSIEGLYEELHRVLEENVALEKKLIHLQRSLLPVQLR